MSQRRLIFGASGVLAFSVAAAAGCVAVSEAAHPFAGLAVGGALMAVMSAPIARWSR